MKALFPLTLALVALLTGCGKLPESSGPPVPPGQVILEPISGFSKGSEVVLSEESAELFLTAVNANRQEIDPADFKVLHTCNFKTAEQGYALFLTHRPPDWGFLCESEDWHTSLASSQWLRHFCYYACNLRTNTREDWELILQATEDRCQTQPNIHLVVNLKQHSLGQLILASYNPTNATLYPIEFGRDLEIVDDGIYLGAPRYADYLPKGVIMVYSESRLTAKAHPSLGFEEDLQEAFTRRLRELGVELHWLMSETPFQWEGAYLRQQQIQALDVDSPQLPIDASP